MVSWIYSEPYILEIWTGVTIIKQSGPIALKMVLANRMQKITPECFNYLAMKDTLLLELKNRNETYFQHFHGRINTLVFFLLDSAS